MYCLPARNIQAANANYRWSVQKTHRRLNMDSRRDDFGSQILQYSDHEGLGMSILVLEKNMNLPIFAGSDTCATVLSGTINYLVKAPHAISALLEEIRSTYTSSPEMDSPIFNDNHILSLDLRRASSLSTEFIWASARRSTWR